MTTERMNYQISNSETGLSKMNDRDRQLRLSTNLNPIYTHQVVNYINARIENVKIREMMLAKATGYPHSALGSFMQRFDSILAECISAYNKQKQVSVAEKQEKPNKSMINPDDLLNLQDELQKKGEIE